MKIFITGAAGFIGKAAVKELVGRGHSLLALVRSKYQAAKLDRMNNVQTVIGDFSDPAKYRAALRKFQPDAAIHLAWEGIPDDSPRIAIKNIAASMLVFKELSEAGVKKIIGVGSCREYGDPRGKIGESASVAFPYNTLYAAKAHLHRLSSAFF
ncbi:MAG: NAD-dependent epimerase/dehydratase family protein, partial [Patescibacteria group bacterium]